MDTVGYFQDAPYHSWGLYNWGDSWAGRSFSLAGNTYGISRIDDNPTVNPRDAGFGSWHPGVCNFLLGDGSVRAISVTTPPGTLDNYGVLLRLAAVDSGLTVSIP
jgi:prepilin-type processing-associated H-X9-DG protein